MAKITATFKSLALNFDETIVVQLSENLEDELWCMGMKNLPYNDIVQKAHKFNLQLALDGDILWLADERYSQEIESIAVQLRELEDYARVYNKLNTLKLDTKIRNMSKEDMIDKLQTLGIGV